MTPAIITDRNMVTSPAMLTYRCSQQLGLHNGADTARDGPSRSHSLDHPSLACLGMSEQTQSVVPLYAARLRDLTWATTVTLHCECGHVAEVRARAVP